MAQAADIVVKDADNTTDVTYALVAASGGDKSPAIWRSNALGTAANQKPTLTMSSRPNGAGTARRVDIQFAYPYTVTGTDGISRVQDKFISNMSAVVPLGIPDSVLAHAAAQFGHLNNHPAIYFALVSGYAAT